MKTSMLRLMALAAATCFSAAVFAQNTATEADATPDPIEIPIIIHTVESDSLVVDTVIWESLTDSLLAMWADTVVPGYVEPKPFPRSFFLPVVYDNYEFLTPITVETKAYSGVPQMQWIEQETAMANDMALIRRDMLFGSPEVPRYNIRMLPEAPKKFKAVVNPQDHTIEITEIVQGPVSSAPTIQGDEVKKRHWIRAFGASLQFSQAYVSPNWYQGGNNNLNALGQLNYNVKLNQSYHPTLLFESNFLYKLGMNTAPEDQYHKINISDDLFQINTTFGLKAVKRWYYTVTGMFKTQLLKSYKTNTNNLRSAFLSPAELNIGLGMTYNYATPKKNFTFDASIAPLSYNLRTCINSQMDPTQFSIDAGHKTKSTFGSSAELKMMWKISYNISLNSRLFLFSDYHRIYGDWENTIAFEINRFLTTQIYVHGRYDTDTARINGTKWSKFQLKEILSIGFAYKFSDL